MTIYCPVCRTMMVRYQTKAICSNGACRHSLPLSSLPSHFLKEKGGSVWPPFQTQTTKKGSVS